MFLEMGNKSRVVSRNVHEKSRRADLRISHLRKCELNFASARPLRRVLNCLCQCTGSTKVRGNSGLQLRPASRKICSIVNRFPYLVKDRFPIRSSEHGATAKECERIVIRPSVVDRDVP